MNLAAEISKGKGKGAAEALLKGHADAAKYRSVYNPADHKSSALTRYVTYSKLHFLFWYTSDIMNEVLTSIAVANYLHIVLQMHLLCN